MIYHLTQNKKGDQTLHVSLRAKVGRGAELGKVYGAHIGPTTTILRKQIITPSKRTDGNGCTKFEYKLTEHGIYQAMEYPAGGSHHTSWLFDWSKESVSQNKMSSDEAALLVGVPHGQYLSCARRYGQQCMWGRARELLSVASQGDAEMKRSVHELRGQLTQLREERREGMPPMGTLAGDRRTDMRDVRDRMDYLAERYIAMGEACAGWLSAHGDHHDCDEYMESVEVCVIICETVREQCRTETRASVFHAMEPAINTSARTFLDRAARTFVPDITSENIRIDWMYLPFRRAT